MKRVLLSALLFCAATADAQSITPIANLAKPVQTDPVNDGDSVSINITVVKNGSLKWIACTPVCADPDPTLTDAATFGGCRTVCLDATGVLTGPQQTALRNLRKQIITSGAFTPTP